MGFHSLLRFCVLVLLVVQLQSHEAYGVSGRGSKFGRRTLIEEIGICASRVIKQGYKCQEFHVTTKDGYILNVQRIPEGRGATANITAQKQPVLIQHGILADGMLWLTNRPEQNLPMILADNGFDVWIANTRGTRFSRRHASLDPNTREYWDWSWDELVAYELPALFDFVHQKTGQKVNYVGHSLGSLTALVSFSQRLVGDKVKSAALLSPIAFLSHIRSILVDVAAKSFLGEAVGLAGLAEFKPRGDPAAEIFLKSICSAPGVNCYDFITALSGNNCCLNASTINANLEIEPQSTSTKNLVHLAQIIRSKVIAKFDGNIVYNLMHYGAIKPPSYNIANIASELPLFLSYGGIDAVSDVEDVENLLDVLKSHNRDKLKVQVVQNYGHLDFIMAVNAKDNVYNQVVDFFKFHN